MTFHSREYRHTPPHQEREKERGVGGEGGRGIQYMKTIIRLLEGGIKLSFIGPWSSWFGLNLGWFGVEKSKYNISAQGPSNANSDSQVSICHRFARAENDGKRQCGRSPSIPHPPLTLHHDA